MGTKILAYQLTDGRTLILEDDSLKIKEKFGLSSLVKKNDESYLYSEIKSISFRIAEEDELIHKTVSYLTFEVSGKSQTLPFQLSKIENLTFERENSRIAYLYLVDKTK